MVYALIFAGGVGSRMGLEKPKQFIEIKGKPILVHTLEVFNNSDIIDEIVVVSLEDHIDFVNKLINKYSLNKVKAVVPGGQTALDSQFNGLKYLKNKSCSNDIVFIHDGVRPFVNNELLKDCLNCVIEKGNAITVSPTTETISILNTDNNIERILPRQNCILARAPQVFYFDDIYNCHLNISDQKNKFVDSASLMMNQGAKLNVVYGPAENIKITTQYDLMLCELWMEQKR